MLNKNNDLRVFCLVRWGVAALVSSLGAGCGEGWLANPYGLICLAPMAGVFLFMLSRAAKKAVDEDAPESAVGGPSRVTLKALVLVVLVGGGGMVLLHLLAMRSSQMVPFAIELASRDEAITAKTGVPLRASWLVWGTVTPDPLLQRGSNHTKILGVANVSLEGPRGAAQVTITCRGSDAEDRALSWEEETCVLGAR